MSSSLQQEDEEDVVMNDALDDTNTNAAASSTCTSADVREEVVVDSIFQHLLQTVCMDVASTLHQQIKTGGGYGVGVPMTSHVLSSSSSSTRTDGANGGSTSTISPAIQSRLQLYPELYEGKSEAEIQQLLEKFAVDLPMVDSRMERSRKRLGTTATAGGQWASASDEDEEDDEDDDKPKKKGKKKKIGGGSDDEDDEDYQMEDDKDDDEMDAGARQKSASSTEEQPAASDANAAAAATGDTTCTPAATLGMVDIWGNRPVAEPTNVTCECPLCGRHVSTSRFASHLDKCMGLSTRPLAGSSMRG